MKVLTIPRVQKLVTTMQKNPAGAALCIALFSLASSTVIAVTALRALTS
jgi:hypothetical protein